MIHLASLVLPELKAARLLARRETACFAACADADGWSDDELCDLVVGTMGRANSTGCLRDAAIALASTARAVRNDGPSLRREGTLTPPRGSPCANRERLQCSASGSRSTSVDDVSELLAIAGV
jgi:hypothetical protein